MIFRQGIKALAMSGLILLLSACGGSHVANVNNSSVKTHPKVNTTPKRVESLCDSLARSLDEANKTVANFVSKRNSAVSNTNEHGKTFWGRMYNSLFGADTLRFNDAINNRNIAAENYKLSNCKANKKINQDV